ncbi:MAG TPA: TetR/AcrR family transcriptional regulator [Gemmatimonadaceae bacterium]|jgi:AcrR family transcriptional regulator|nr:TetR/AcrR family transcriptional regulator [Gemmatimonadaceae bacterium]
MTKSTTAARIASSDDPVLEIAGRLFRKNGFDATTVRQIADAAGLLPGSLHYRYSTKEEMLLALVERGIAHATEAVRLAVADATDPFERMRLALRAHLRLLIRDDVAIYVTLYEGRSLSGDSRAHMVRLRDRYDALWDGILHAAAGTGRLRRDIDLSLVRLLLLGAANWTAQWFSPSGSYSCDEVADAYADLLWRGLAQPGDRPVLELTPRRRRGKSV